MARHGIDVELLTLNGGAGPAALTPQSALDALQAHWQRAGGVPLTLVGSSFGGWAAARYAELHPGRVRRLLLLNPGFELGRRWECIVGTAALEAWRRDGARTFAMPSTGEPCQVPREGVRGSPAHHAPPPRMHPTLDLRLPTPTALQPPLSSRVRALPLSPPTPLHARRQVPWSFVEQTRAEAGTPAVSTEAVVLHGRRDEVVPPSLSEAFVHASPLARLVLLDDDHALTAPPSLERIAREALAACGGEGGSPRDGGPPAPSSWD